MLIQSPIISDASGSAGGVTLFRSRSGMELRPRQGPGTRTSAPSNAARATLSGLTEAWRASLSNQQRADWGAFATRSYRTLAPFNRGWKSGRSAFFALNVIRQRGKQPLALNPPIAGTTATPVNPSSITAQQINQQLQINWNGGDYWLTQTTVSRWIRIYNPFTPNHRPRRNRVLADRIGTKPQIAPANSTVFILDGFLKTGQQLDLSWYDSFPTAATSALFQTTVTVT